MPQRHIYVRRMSQELVNSVPYLYRFPVYSILEECSKHMLMTEIELLQWYDVARDMLGQFNESNNLKSGQIRIVCYFAARQVKQYFQSADCDAIDTYLSNFQFPNFKEQFLQA